MVLKVQGVWEADRMVRLLDHLSKMDFEGNAWLKNLVSRLSAQVENEKGNRKISADKTGPGGVAPPKPQTAEPAA